MLSPMEEYVAYGWKEQLFLLIGISLIMGLGKGGVPGLATVAMALTVATSPDHIEGALGLAVALQVPILTMIDISAAWLHYEDLDWHSIGLLLPLSFVGMVLGTFLDRWMTDSAARLLVGVMLLVMLLPGAPKQKKGHKKDDDEVDLEGQSCSPKTEKKHSLFWAVIVGILGGAVSMLTNSMGPILNVYLLSVANLPPTAYVGTRAMFFSCLNLGKIPLRFWSGSLGFCMIPLAMTLGFVSILGVVAAKPIFIHMDETMFVRLELAVVLFSGLRLLWVGFQGVLGQ